jgi:hypothetical protein
MKVLAAVTLVTLLGCGVGVLVFGSVAGFGRGTPPSDPELFFIPYVPMILGAGLGGAIGLIIGGGYVATRFAREAEAEAERERQEPSSPSL